LTNRSLPIPGDHLPRDPPRLVRLEAASDRVLRVAHVTGYEAMNTHRRGVIARVKNIASTSVEIAPDGETRKPASRRAPSAMFDRLTQADDHKYRSR
jgi:hypothetical protein